MVGRRIQSNAGEMGWRWSSVTMILLVVASVGVFAGGGHLTAISLIEDQRTRQLDDLVQLALRRSEATVDYAAATLQDVGRQGPMDCTAATLQQLRLSVYQRGPVKDIRAADHSGAVRCSAYSETLEFDRRWPLRQDMLPASDGAVRLFRVEQFFGTALGVLEDVDPSNSLIAILAVNTSLLDVMPAQLRGHSSVSIELADGSSIAQLLASENSIALPSTVDATSNSDRYPLRSVVRVETAAYRAWNREAYVPIMVLASALGLVFGVLLARTVRRPDDPVASLDRAIEGQQFRPFLQPLFELGSGAINGCEMLARWVQPDGTVVAPARFIKLAEDTGRIQQMTWQMLTSALEELRPQLSRDKFFRFSLNISPRHFLSDGFVDELREVVTGARVSYRQIVVELTEREGIEDFDKAASVVAELQGYGFRVAIDDVGIGNSGLSQLQRLGADILKIDKFFVDTINRDATAKSIVEMLVRLASRLKMSIVAEGIEDREQLETLRKCGVSVGQGYLFSPPVPVNVFLELLERAPGIAKRSANGRASAA